MSEAPLSSAQLLLVSEANQRARKIQRTAGIAAFNGWTIGFFAVASFFLTLLSFSIVGMAISIGLGVVAFNEFRGRTLIRQFAPNACSLLGWNQVGFTVLIVAYCGWNIAYAYFAPDAVGVAISEALAAYPELGDVGPEIEEQISALYLPLVLTLYGSVIVLSVLFQGGNALYYFARGRLLQQYLEETEPWVIEIQKATGGH
jgi:hypothetical protein